MPSSDVSNKALGHAAAEVAEILARALQWKKGRAGHLSMAMEMANIMSPVFAEHGQAATKISLVLLSVAMELMEHWDPVGRTSFVTMLVWKNIVMDDPCIMKHPLHAKARNFVIPAAQSTLPSTVPLPSSEPVPCRSSTATAGLPAPSHGTSLKPKPTPKPVVRKKKVDLSLASDGIESVEEEPAQDSEVADVTGTSHGKQKGKIVPSEELESDISMDELLTDVILKSDVKGKGKAVASPDDMVEDCGCMQSWRKRPRDANGSRPPVKQTIISSLPDDAAPQWRPWFNDSLQLPVAETAIISKKHKSGHRRSTSIDQQEGTAKHGISNAKDPALTEDITAKSAGPELELPCRLSVGKDTSTRQRSKWDHSLAAPVHGRQPKMKVIFSTEVLHTLTIIDMLVPDTDGAGQAAPPTLSVPPIATLSLVPPSMPPARNQIGTWPTEIRHSTVAEEFEMDVSGDAVVKELQAMTLEVKETSASLIEKNEDLQASMNALKMEVAVLKGCNAAATELLDAIKVRLAAHDADIRTLDGMRTELTALQEDVKAVQAESRTQEEQLQAVEAKLASQSHTTAILQDTYEALQQHVVSNVSIPPPFPQPMFIPIPSYVCGPSVADSTGNSGLNSVAGSSNQATSSSEVGQVFSESASGMGPN
ncbi:hypothetical protein F4604DRAFT_1947373 [Suillus subluteus]|nr:hypothetical protein F4604DRAFT_1947373 [Suillus subluteus]